MRGTVAKRLRNQAAQMWFDSKRVRVNMRMTNGGRRYVDGSYPRMYRELKKEYKQK